jgi:hypothetical protein
MLKQTRSLGLTQGADRPDHVREQLDRPHPDGVHGDCNIFIEYFRLRMLIMLDRFLFQVCNNTGERSCCISLQGHTLPGDQR